MRQLLSEAIEDWTRFRQSQDIKKGTLRVNTGVLRRFLAVNGNIYCHNIGDRHVTRHFEEAAKTRQAQSLRNDHAVLSTFFDWCRHTRRMALDNDPLYGRRKPKRVEKERERVPVDKFPALLDAAEAVCSRDRIAVAILLYTLLRDQEVADLRVRDVDLAGGWLRARIHKTTEEDTMPISEELDYELRRWLTHYTEQVGELHPNYRLVPARRVILEHRNGRFVAGGDRLTVLKPETPVGALGDMVRPILDSIGFPIVDMNGEPSREGAHTIRRSGARALFDDLAARPAEERDGDPLRVVQAMLHHKSVVQTETYIGLKSERRARDTMIRGRRMFSRSGNNVVALIDRNASSGAG